MLFEMGTKTWYFNMKRTLVGNLHSRFLTIDYESRTRGLISTFAAYFINIQVPQEAERERRAFDSDGFMVSGSYPPNEDYLLPL